MSCAAAGAVGIKERTMRTTIPSFVGFANYPWNKGRLIGQKRPLKPKEVWAIRVRLQLLSRNRGRRCAERIGAGRTLIWAGARPCQGGAATTQLADLSSAAEGRRDRSSM